MCKMRTKMLTQHSASPPLACDRPHSRHLWKTSVTKKVTGAFYRLTPFADWGRESIMMVPLLRLGAQHPIRWPAQPRQGWGPVGDYCLLPRLAKLAGKLNGYPSHGWISRFGYGKTKASDMDQASLGRVQHCFDSEGIHSAQASPPKLHQLVAQQYWPLMRSCFSCYTTVEILCACRSRLTEFSFLRNLLFSVLSSEIVVG